MKIVDSSPKIRRFLPAMALKSHCIPLNSLRPWAFGGKGAEGMRKGMPAFSKGGTVIAESGVGWISHIDEEGNLVNPIPFVEEGRKKSRLMPILDNGHRLACLQVLDGGQSKMVRENPAADR